MKPASFSRCETSDFFGLDRFGPYFILAGARRDRLFCHGPCCSSYGSHVPYNYFRIFYIKPKDRSSIFSLSPGHSCVATCAAASSHKAKSLEENCCTIPIMGLARWTVLVIMTNPIAIAILVGFLRFGKMWKWKSILEHKQ